MENKEHRLAAIMYTDIKDFSRMMEMDELGTLRLLDYHNEVIKKEIQEHRGKLIKTIGDAVLAHFPTAMDAVQAAIGVQMVFSEYNLSHREKPLLVRIGVHLGDIYFTADDAFGEGINIAARLESISQPGRICLSQEVYNQVDGKLEVYSRDLGRVELKNITRVINAHELIIPSPPGKREGKSGEEKEKAAAEMEVNTPGKTAEEREPAQLRLEKAWEQWDKRVTLRAGAGTRDTEGRQDPYSFYRHWSQRLYVRLDKAEGAFRSHLTTYLAVNTGLLLLNVLTSPGFPWFVFPAGGWGIGLLNHGAELRNLRKDKQLLAELPELDKEELNLFRKIRRGDKKRVSGWTSALAVSGFLVMVNLVTSSGFFWSLIPSSILLLVNGAQAGNWKQQRRRYWEQLKGLLGRARRGNSPWDGAAGTGPEESSGGDQKNRQVEKEAEKLRLAILEQMKSFDENPLGDGAKEVLDNYVNQIAILSEKNREMARLLSHVPLDGLEAEVTELREKAAQVQSDALKREYDQALEDIERQRESVTSLREQKEVLELRMGAAVNSLKQMNIDLARMKNLSNEPENTPQLEQLRRRSRDLSQYIEDFSEGYGQLSLEESSPPE